MRRSLSTGLGSLLMLYATSAFSQGNSDIFYGGTLGLGFGDVDYVEISPMLGKNLSPQLAAGGSLIFRHRSDDRYQQKLTTDDYGFSLFGRYRATPTTFAQVEYEYLDYEFYKVNLTKDSDTANSVFVGGGVNSAVNRNTALFMTVLYNVLYDNDSPYDSPWVIRFGVGVGF